jgi:hypothetical protein
MLWKIKYQVLLIEIFKIFRKLDIELMLLKLINSWTNSNGKQMLN